MNTKLFGLMAAAALIFTACDNNDEPKPTIDPVETFSGNAYVLGTGVEGYSAIDGGIGVYNGFDYTVSPDLFSITNGRSIGMTSNHMAISAGHAVGIVSVTKSNTLEIVEIPSLRSHAQISLADSTFGGPRHAAFSNKDQYAYATMNTGHLARVDVAKGDIDAVVKFEPLEGSYVGTYPEGLAIVDDKAYVALSGMADGLENRVAVVDLKTMTVSEYIPVTTNLTDVFYAGDKLYVLSAGWYDAANGYAQTDAGLYLLDGTKVVPATSVAQKDDALYYINNPYGSTTTTLGCLNAKSGTASTIAEPVPAASPTAIGVSPLGGYLLIGSLQMGEYGYPAYDLPGYVVRYDLSNGATTEIQTEIYGINGFIFY